MARPNGGALLEASPQATNSRYDWPLTRESPSECASDVNDVAPTRLLREPEKDTPNPIYGKLASCGRGHD